MTTVADKVAFWRDRAQREIPGPPIPLGQRVDLPDRGITFYREVRGPRRAPTVFLLHGWIASGGLNWYQTFEPLGEHFRVIAPDHRGHGRGLRSHRRFTLAQCADDAAALIGELDCGPVIAVGYSMGGPIAQLLWRRHPHLVDGLVFCATAPSFMSAPRERYLWTSAMATLAGTSRFGQLASRLPLRGLEQVTSLGIGNGNGGSSSNGNGTNGHPPRPDTMRQWAGQEMRRHDLRAILEAGWAVGNFDSSEWIGEIDVPTAVLVTRKDRAITPTRQLSMAQAIDGATVHSLEHGHISCAREDFGDPLVEACLDVAGRV